jgi:threonine dehydrogenase-like Zn-dependent dehydrogenase
MKAIALTPGTTELRIVDRPEPTISAPDEVKLQVLQVGICGTDREEAAGGRAQAPSGQKELIIGHELLGLVVEVGAGVRAVQPGDHAVFTVRRGCGHCAACAIHRSDMCYSGDYADRGITNQDGYQAEFVVDKERYAVRVPQPVASVGVLSEPMSIAQKAVDEALTLQLARLPDAPRGQKWLDGKHALIAGLGPIGLLAAFALRLRGAEVIGLDVVDADNRRAQLLEEIGGRYVNGRKSGPEAIGERFGQIDLIFEATGVAHLEFDLLSALGANGVYVLTGIPGGDRPVDLDVAALVRRLVLGNQLMVGSVNASRRHFELGVRDLENAKERWGDAIDRMITHRFPYARFADVLTQHPEDEIKAVVQWAEA